MKFDDQNIFRNQGLSLIFFVVVRESLFAHFLYAKSSKRRSLHSIKNKKEKIDY